MTGFWCLIFLGRWSMVLGWVDLIKRRLTHDHEFVSADARRLSNDPRTYEMLSSPSSPQPMLKPPDNATMSSHSFRKVNFSPEPDSKSEYFGDGTMGYLSPVSNFSSPRPSHALHGREWDSTTTYARGERTLTGADLSKKVSL